MKFFRNNYSSTNPVMPSSLLTRDHGMREDSATQDQQNIPRPTPHTLTDITPYLGLRARLSQVWINRWTILILLVLARVLIAIGNLNNDIDSAKAEALSACSSVEAMGSAMASMPHYLAGGVNELAASGVEHAVNGLHEMLMMTVTGVEEIIVFYINSVYGMYECLITFAVAGSLHAVIATIEDAEKFVQNSIHDIGDDIQNAVNDFSKSLNSFLSTINNVESIFTGTKGSPPTFDISADMSKLTGLQIPQSVNQGLDKLNSSIPDFAQVQNFTDNVIRMPFEEIKKLMNQSLGTFSFDRSVFPVPVKEQLTFCNDNSGINDFFDSLYHIADVAYKVFIVVCVFAAVLACIPMAYLEIRRWRSTKQTALRMKTYATDPMDAIYIAARPWTARTGLWVSSKARAPRGKVLLRWFVAYATTVPALVLLSIALAGLFSCFCQYLVLKAIEKEVPILASEAGAFGDQVIDILNNASAKWANDTNAVIMKTNNDINQNVFGWVNTSTHAMNETLNVFVNDTIDVLNKTFGGTVLYDPIVQVFNCLIGLKVAGIEKGLTWASDHAHIDFPLFPNDTFSKGAAEALSNNTTTADGQNNSFLAEPGDLAADKITNAVVTLTTKLANGLRTETLIATTLLCLYLLLVLMGLARVLWCSVITNGRHRGEGGPSLAGDLDHFDVPTPPYEPNPPMQPKARGFSTQAPPYASPMATAYDKAEEADYEADRFGFAGQRKQNRVLVGHTRQSSQGELIGEKF